MIDEGYNDQRPMQFDQTSQLSSQSQVIEPIKPRLANNTSVNAEEQQLLLQNPELTLKTYQRMKT